MIFIFLLTIFSCFHSILPKPTLSEEAEQVLSLVAYELPAPSIIGDREWKELQLDRLVTILDRTTTSFGRWGLVQLLHPIADKKELAQRKEIITFLIEHEKEMKIFQQQLERVHRVEKSLLAYWDEQDQLNSQTKQFYFSLLGLKEVSNYLNKNSLVLNASVAMEMFNSGKYLLISLALGGVSLELNRWLLGDQENINIMGSIKEGLTEPIRHHSWSPALNAHKKYLVDPNKDTYQYKDYMKSFLLGSWGDRFRVMYKGYLADPEVMGLSGEKKHISFGLLGSFIAATVPTLFFDYQRGTSIFSIGTQIASMYNNLNSLQQRVSDVAQCIDAIEQLQKMVSKQAPTLRSYLSHTDEYDDERNMVIKKLLVPRFLKKSDYVYSRGHVLTMHKEFTYKKKTIIPLLHSVALLDAYCSIAQLYKESQNQPVVFSFAEFVEAEKPFLDYRDGWLPLLPYDQAVANDLLLGGNQPSKMIITGPNGGGKSTILKALGMAILPQSWCIAPARSAKQTLFSSIRTALSPREDLEHGLSTFMAEKKTMAEILEDIVTADPQNHMLVLIDEPYKGTVDAESAKRIYQFGKDIAGYPQALLALATHVKKPIQLAQEMPGVFSNYQVKINEMSTGIFERLFKLVLGAAMWWFEDDAKRSRFVDWISVKGESSTETQ